MRNEAGNVVGLMPHPEHAVDPDVGPPGGSRCSPRCSRARWRGPGVTEMVPIEVGFHAIFGIGLAILYRCGLTLVRGSAMP